jgi:hypothetical protein
MTTTDVHLFSFTSPQLARLADGIIVGDPAAVETCVLFVCAETRGFGHGRVRARMCRRLKHATLSQQQRAAVVDAVCRRLTDGRFSEQFRDQLRLALVLDAPVVLLCAQRGLTSDVAHVQRMAAWVLRAAQQRRLPV